MNIVRSPRWLPPILLVAGVGLAAYQLIFYAGLYRWASELQYRHFGFSYGLASLLPLAICFIPYWLVAPPPDDGYGRWLHQDSFPTYAEYAITQARRQLRWLRIAVPALVLIVLGALIYAQTLPAAPPAPVPINLAHLGDRPPPLGVVALAAQPDIAHTASILRLDKGGEDRMVVPLIGSGKQYFVSLYGADYQNKAAIAALRQSGRILGTLRHGTPGGELRAALEKTGFAVAEDGYVLDTEIHSPRHAPRAIAIMAGIVLSILAIYLAVALQRLRKFKAQMADEVLEAASE